MSVFLQVVTTIDSRQGAEQLVQALLKQRLASCVQILGPANSYYWWQGEIQSSEEYLCLIKTRQDLFADLEEAVKVNHPYDVPEILAFPVAQASDTYAQWMNDELKKTDES